MRFVLVAQLAATALLVCGCPGAESTDPSGGAICLSGQILPGRKQLGRRRGK